MSDRVRSARPLARPSSLSPLFAAGAIALAALWAAPPLYAADGWETLSQKDGVTVERRPHPGSDFYELRARAVCEVAPQELFAAVWSYRDYPAFVPYLKSLQVLDEQDGSATVYQQIAMPLVSDRDYTLKLSRAVSDDGSSWKMVFDSVENVGPKASSTFVRAQNIHGSWSLEPLDGGRATQVTYQLYSEPGGAVPSWIVNLAQKDAPKNLLLAMMKRAKQRSALSAASPGK